MTYDLIFSNFTELFWFEFDFFFQLILPINVVCKFSEVLLISRNIVSRTWYKPPIIQRHDLRLPSAPLPQLSALFADEIEIHNTNNTKNEAKSILQQYLYEIENWTEKWKLIFSVGKCASLTFTRRRSSQP